MSRPGGVGAAIHSGGTSTPEQPADAVDAVDSSSIRFQIAPFSEMAETAIGEHYVLFAATRLNPDITIGGSQPFFNELEQIYNSLLR